MKLFRKNKKRKALVMQLTLCSNDIKIKCGWRVTSKATQPYINPILLFLLIFILNFFYSYDFDELKKLCR